MELSLAWRMLLDVMSIAILKLFGHDKAFNEESTSGVPLARCRADPFKQRSCREPVKVYTVRDLMRKP